MTGPRTVLLVDDNDFVRRLLSRMLERLGHRVFAAPDGASARAVFEHAEEPIELVMADLELPDINGRRLAQELRRRQPSLPIILVSGRFEDEPGEFPELSKPFTFEALEQRIAAAFGFEPSESQGGNAESPKGVEVIDEAHADRGPDPRSEPRRERLPDRPSSIRARPST